MMVMMMTMLFFHGVSDALRLLVRVGEALCGRLRLREGAGPSTSFSLRKLGRVELRRMSFLAMRALLEILAWSKEKRMSAGDYDGDDDGDDDDDDNV